MLADAFRRFLKAKGKKDHVVEGLVKATMDLEAYLSASTGTDLASAGANDLASYLTHVERLGEGKAKKSARAISLYYAMVERRDMASLASNYREGAIASTRAAFKLEDFRGVNKEHTESLKRLGVANVDDMIRVGKTPAERVDLSHRSGVPLAAILELVKLADLSRLGAIKAVRARLYHDAGIDTPDKMAGWEPDALRAMLQKWVESSGFQGIAPLPEELRKAVAAARSLPRLVEY